MTDSGLTDMVSAVASCATAVDKFLLPEFDGEMNFAGLAHLIALRNSWRANPAPRFRSAL